MTPDTLAAILAGVTIAALLKVNWDSWLGCKVRGHDYRPRSGYGATFCYRAAWHVENGKHVK